MSEHPECPAGMCEMCWTDNTSRQATHHLYLEDKPLEIERYCVCEEHAWPYVAESVSVTHKFVFGIYRKGVTRLYFEKR